MVKMLIPLWRRAAVLSLPRAVWEGAENLEIFVCQTLQWGSDGMKWAEEIAVWFFSTQNTETIRNDVLPPLWVCVRLPHAKRWLDTQYGHQKCLFLFGKISLLECGLSYVPGEQITEAEYDTRLWLTTEISQRITRTRLCSVRLLTGIHCPSPWTLYTLYLIYPMYTLTLYLYLYISEEVV